jgi:hypothetical protein
MDDSLENSAKLTPQQGANPQANRQRVPLFDYRSEQDQFGEQV